MNLLFALLFSILYFLTALALVLLGKEAPIFATAGLGYLVASLIVLWGGYFFVQRRRPRHPRLLFFSLGALVFGSVFPLFYATEAYDDYRDNRARKRPRNPPALFRSRPPHRKLLSLPSPGA
jgi:drug/metabolite transporter (DMT)-like permease